MDEIVKAVSEKTGLPEAQAEKAVEAVLEVIKDRLPEPIAGQIDGLLTGEGGSGIFKSLGGLLGK